MKNIATLSFFFFLAFQAMSQDDVLLIAGHYYTDSNQSLDSKYLGFHNTTSVPYHIDANGRVSGRRLTFYENGSIETLGNYRSGIKHGLWMSYDANGNVLSQAYYTDGKKDGAWKVWDAMGVLRCEMYYKNGLRIKTWKFYDETGVLRTSQAY